MNLFKVRQLEFIQLPFLLGALSMTYDQITTEVVPESVIIFKEYEFDRHEHKRLSLEIGPVPVESVVFPQHSLCREELEKYYEGEVNEPCFGQYCRYLYY